VPQLICNVRDCSLPLTREADALRCADGHSFDRARSGYWNLLQPQDRKSPQAGDRAEAVDARGRWLERGHAAGLARLIGRVGGIETLPAGATLIDIGCGTGWFTAQLAAGRGWDVCGLDLSSRAVRQAARLLLDATWIVANADRGLPLADRSVELALSIFGRRPVAELVRVLKPDGCVVVAVPAEDDLAELREASQGQAAATERVSRVIEEFRATPLRPTVQETWRQREPHDRAGLDDLLAMTYRGARQSQRQRLLQQLGDSESLDVTLAAHVVRLERQAQ
jgi:23S rRNA (guanine745-N1)-methyltransferase